MNHESRALTRSPFDPQGLQPVIDRLPTSILVLSSEGKVVLANRTFAQTLAAEAASLAGLLLEDALRHPEPEVRTLLRRGVDQAVSGESVWFETHLVEDRKDGTHVEFSLEPLRDEEGQVSHIIVTMLDTSEQMRVAAKLHEGNERFQALVDLIPQLVWTTTPDGYHDYFNQRWYEYTGMPREGSQGWNWKDYLHPDDYEPSLEVWQHSLATGEPYEVEYRFRRASDGAYRWFIGRAMPLRSDDGTIVRWFGTCTDVHEERTAMDAARRSEERFRLVTRATNDVVWEWDIATGRLWWNENMERVFRLDGGHLTTFDDWEARLHPDDREEVMRGLEPFLAGEEEVWSAEYRFLRGDDVYCEVVGRATAVRDQEGRPRSMIGSLSDVTEKNRLEEELRTGQRLEAVGRLAGGIAHDFNNLLTVIANSAQFALDELPATEGLEEDLNEVLRASQRASGLTRQLLAFSRRQVLQPRILDLNEILTGSRSMLERVIGESIRMEFSPDPELRPVKADQAQLEQVIMNLALNARDAMPTGGTLTLSTRNGTVPAERAQKHPEASLGEYVRLSVVDTGIGMDREVRDRVFEPFFTTKELDQGTGLGLPTVQGIVAQSGGFIELESEPGKGTKVHVYLPVAPLTSNPEPIGEEPESAPGSQPATGVILVVEDQEPIRRVARRILAREGYTVLEAPNGNAALELIRSGREPIDLVLTDMVMPGMGGRELVARVQAEGSTLLFVFMSGYTEEEVLQDSVGSKPLRVLEKPFSAAELSAAVTEALSEVR